MALTHTTTKPIARKTLKLPRRKHSFSSLAEHASNIAGSLPAFILAVLVIIGWAIAGPYYHYSDSWHLLISTIIGIPTFLLVFLIQHNQNRDIKALHIKLGELIRSTNGAHMAIIDLEKLDHQALVEVHARYEALAKEARRKMRKGVEDTGVAEIILSNAEIGKSE